jgi:thiol-disulfide isomerase/thioredoxin
MKKKIKKSYPYLIIILVLLISGAVYFQVTKSAGKPLIPKSIKLNSQKDEPAAPEDKSIKFQNYGPAPEFAGIDKWFNGGPVTKEQMKDKVVLVNFWTYSSINSIRSIPYVTDWANKYRDQGLIIIGIHTPEFAFEKVSLNVESALKKYGITYPVGQDNNYKTWMAYKNQFWPAQYLIDKNGNIVYTHFGEGKYEQTELAIRTLLGLEGEFKIPEAAVQNQAGTPEIHLGLTRLNSFGGTEKTNNGRQIYTFPSKLKANQFALEGQWEFTQEAAVHTAGFGRMRLNFNAAKVYLVAESEKPVTLKIFVDGKLIKGVVISSSDLYELFDTIAGGDHTMEIEVPEGGLKAFTFTFG